MKKVMRKGSIAIVPIMLSILVMFWFIWFLGGESEQLQSISEHENLQHLQENLLVAAVKRRYALAEADPSLTDAELDRLVDDYIDQVMVLNKIQE
ncbi:hypothetical protein GJV85_07495 [Sulfurimonas aquatica]|uniref:Uncharacterized protein n=1 Tax=Sulfurimonas aquatica TaxID=2672570 RepID=A0A975B0G7_9BACT|nr:hypothetical protein [Sulfurimonas aquatica]QSZ41957.1 hypothetical protein GJV85_07495 [Sulfurimonas aquatica]